MSWKESAKLISKMPKNAQDDPVVLVADYNGPDGRIIYLDAVRATEDVWVGISVGNECVVSAGEWFLCNIEEDAEGDRP